MTNNTASKCVTGIYTSNYNVTFYDMDYNNVPYTTKYAVKLTNQSVNGLYPTPTPTPTLTSSDVVLPSSTVLSAVPSTLSSPSPTPGPDNNNSKLL